MGVWKKTRPVQAGPLHREQLGLSRVIYQGNQWQTFCEGGAIPCSFRCLFEVNDQGHSVN